NNQLGQVTTQLKKVDDQMKGISKSGGMISNFFGGMTAKFKEWGSTIATVFSVTAITSFFKGSAQEAIKAEKSAQQYGFAIKNVAKGTQADVDQLLQQAKELMGVFSHEEIEVAGKKMIDFGLSVQEVSTIMPLMVDAAAQSRFGLEELATAIDKGKESGVFFKSALGQLGVNFKDTGDKAQNFNLIVQGLTKFTGGNSAALTTNWGKLKNLGIMWEELKEHLGEQMFGDTSNGVIGGLTSLTKYLGENAVAVFNVIKALGSLLLGLTVYKVTALAISAIEKIRIDYAAIAIARTKAQTIATQAQSMATEGQAIATEGAAVAQEGLNTAVKSNPIGLILSVLATVVALIWQYASATNKATEDQKKFNEILEETKSKLKENEATSRQQQMNVKSLFEALKGEQKTQEDKLIIYGKINAMLKDEHIPMLLNEKSSIDDVKAAEDALTGSILKNMQLRANQIQLEGKMKLGAEALMAAERVENERLIAQKIAQAVALQEKLNGITMTVNDYQSNIFGESDIKGFSQTWSDILADAVAAGDIKLSDNLKDVAKKLEKRRDDFKATADSYSKESEKYIVADKK
ncbi:MAG: hypothetical protein WCL06_15680, partial [Bacteroidota bacterium]